MVSSSTKKGLLLVLGSVLIAIAVGIFVFVTKDNTDYLNVIPAKSKMLISFDFGKIAKMPGKSGDAEKAFLDFLKVGSMSDCGINLKKKTYLFEAPDGTLGLVAPVASERSLTSWFERLAEAGKCSGIVDRRGFRFTVISGNFVAGYSSGALLVMGPSVGAGQAELQRQMIKYLAADEEDGISAAAMFKRLGTMNSPVALVAQAHALPDNFAAPFTLGAPRGTDPGQVLIASSMDVNDGNLIITGETFSFNKQVDDALKAAAAKYKPISGRFLNTISSDDLLSVACNVDGKDFIGLLRNNREFRTLLAGANTAIDIDMMIKGINGDIVMSVPAMKASKLDFRLIADVDDDSWLNDVDYWKKSCPEGCRIENWKQPRTYHFSGPDWNTYFGLKDGKKLFFVSSPEMADAISKPSKTPVSESVINAIKGKKLTAVVSLASANQEKKELETVSAFMRPLFGDISSIIIIVE